MDQKYDYAYTPDNSKKSWRLSKGGGNGVGGASGGDWSHDGIRRYYTGGAITRGAATIGGGSSKHILSIGSMDVDVGSIDGVLIDSPDRKSRISGGDENMLDGNLVPDPKSDAALNGDNENDLQDFAAEEDMVDVDIAPSSEDVALESPAFAGNNSKIGSTNASIRCKTNNSNSANITAFESLYHLSHILAWRLRSAYAPTTPQEHHLLSLGSELFAQRHPAKADGIIKGLEMTKMCEERVCEGLRRMGELISMCERMKGRRLAVPSSDDDEDGMLEAAEAVFAYFCEKNVLPMLVDSILLSRPHPLVSNVSDSSLALGDDGTINSPQSPFSGVTWTSSVKSQILQTISMIVFNTSSPLSRKYFSWQFIYPCCPLISH